MDSFLEEEVKRLSLAGRYNATPAPSAAAAAAANPLPSPLPVNNVHHFQQQQQQQQQQQPYSPHQLQTQQLQPQQVGVRQPPVQQQQQQLFNSHNQNQQAQTLTPQQPQKRNGTSHNSPATSSPTQTAARAAGVVPKRLHENPISNMPDPDSVDVRKAAAAAAAAPPPAPVKRKSTTPTGRPSSGSKELTEKEKEAFLKEKEQAVRDALKSKQLTLKKEAHRLAHIDKELEAIHAEDQKEINGLRKSLELVERDLQYIEKDYLRKKEAFEVAKKIYEAKRGEKSTITASLTKLVLASEEKRDKKLNELLASVEGDKKAPR